ncbi:TPM domain-containing protein [Clostridium sp. MCC353]|uniref:TPM domain-containing protein n=1 Tax=Clostridium sp. MCC353 TaxID=2592646 RepID=UPI001C02BE65|nr:TPM domain-containing protein [Clostridium sp. MCC353]MBT9776347.1 TPM domain-containing protein [Clostridium sp. MCC353]
MMSWSKIIKNIRLLVMVMFCLAFCMPVWAGTSETADESQRVFDHAGLFTSAQTASMETEIAELQKKMKMDVVVATTKDSGGKSAVEYADDFYDYGGFGTGNDYNGLLFLIDMDNRELTISTSGIMRRYLTDKRIDSMLDRIYEYASQGDYEGCVEQFLKDTLKYYNKGIQAGQYIYDVETGSISFHRSIRWYEWMLALGVSLFAAGSSCLSVVRKYGMKKERRKSADFNLAYRADCHFALQNQSDSLVNKFVTQAVIPRHTSSGSSGGGGRSGGSGRSSVHRSSSGRSHGGGSRKF